MTARRRARPSALRPALRLAAGALAALAAAGTGGTGAYATPQAFTAGPATAGPAATGQGGGPVAAPVPLKDDSVRSEQWHLKTLRVAEAWTYSSGEGVTVAVIDSGVEADHVDLAGQVLPGLDMVSGAGVGHKDGVGHGTTVAAIIAGRGDDDSGVVGIAPKAKILPVRVLDDENRYDDALVVAKGVRWAVDHGARVINLSLGGNGSSPALAAALDYAFAKDVVVVACTGNKTPSGPSDVWYPAREPGVLAVAGMERNGDVLWPDSITGSQTVLTAPATQIVGAGPEGYWQVQGTSFAAPMVSGTAALIRSRWPMMSAPEVINRIIRTAKDRGAPGKDAEYGYGLVNPSAALTADVPVVTSNPLDTAPPPGVSRFGSAPQAGRLQATTGSSLRSPPGLRAPGANAGWAVSPAEPAQPRKSRGWWAAAAFLLFSGMVGVFTVRRFSGLV